MSLRKREEDTEIDDHDAYIYKKIKFVPLSVLYMNEYEFNHWLRKCNLTHFEEREIILTKNDLKKNKKN